MTENGKPGRNERIAFWITLAVGAVVVIGGIELVRWLLS